jgi:6-phosphogluconolactonase
MTNETLPFAYTVLVSNALDAEIRSFNLDTATGRIDPSLTYAAADAVMPMALSADRKLLYVATRGVAPSIITYCVDSLTGQLSRLGTAANIESSLAYLCAEPSGRYLLGASYGEHRLSIYSVDGIAQANGKPLQVIENIEHAHAVIVSPDARFAYVSSLGSNRVFCFSLDAGLTGEPAAFVEHASLGEGFGPRHLRFSPDSTMLYVLSEFRATVALFQRDSVTGHIDPKGVSARPQAISELNDGRARPNLTAAVQLDPKTLQSLVWAADLQVTPDNRFAYVSERTSSRLIVYRVHADASLEYASFIQTETQPRGFQIDPTGRYLVACGEKSSHVAVYAINAESGALSLLSRCEGGRGANWVEIIDRTQSAAPASARPL